MSCVWPLKLCTTVLNKVLLVALELLISLSLKSLHWENTAFKVKLTNAEH